MNNYKQLITIDEEPQDNVIKCYYDRERKKRAVVFKNNQTTYYYNYNKVKWLESIGELDKDNYKFFLKTGQELFDIVKIIEFRDCYTSYIRVFFKNGYFKSYKVSDLDIKKNMVVSPKVKNLIEYYSRIADITGLKADDGTNILKAKFGKLDFISDDTVLAKYLNSSSSSIRSENDCIIFPFGCNASQIAAVRNALVNQISVIEGPPGTGKTQTILNIIANIVMRGYTVAVVSNNNSATDNVFEKLQKYHYDYIAAQLGSDKNKKVFIQNKQQKYPDFTNDKLDYSAKNELSSHVKNCEAKLTTLFETQNKIAELKHTLSALKLEKEYFDEYFNTTHSEKSIFRRKDKLSLDKILTIWNELQTYIENEKSISFWYKVKSILLYGVANFDIYNSPIEEIIEQLKKIFYEIKILEMENEIQQLEKYLSENNISNLISQLTNKSNQLLKASLADKYSTRTERPTFDADDLWKRSSAFLKEYPVILSTTFSATSSLKNIIYDYVIVDEASQVDLTTGVLAMSCAKNMVIVGDLKQLPNVVPEDVRKTVAQLSIGNNIALNYRYEENSLLSSMCKTYENISRTLLREHYRCHPKIIGFCNQKIYNNQLVIMTQDNGESDVLKAYITVDGNHARGHFNQRQIDEITNNILPELNSSDVGIIAPYKDQTSALADEITEQIDISTVHKFQGREKDDIIISTVDNEITEFTDNPNMLNVAVSRAKKRLRIVVSANKNNSRTNIGDLIKYIQYNNFEIKHSEINSVFDMLYKCYEEKRKSYLKKHKRISEYDSENLMYALINDVLKSDVFSKFDVISHQPLNAIICNFHKLSDEETAYAKNPLTHINFIIFNVIDKSPVLAIEVDGYAYHNDNIKQSDRDKLKNSILEKYNIPLIRFNTTGSMEKEKLEKRLMELI